MMMLPFISVDDVHSAFHLLLDLIPDNLGLDPFLGYSKFTWIEGLTTGIPPTGRSANSTARTTSWNPGTRNLLPTLNTQSQQCVVS